MVLPGSASRFPGSEGPWVGLGWHLYLATLGEWHHQVDAACSIATLWSTLAWSGRVPELTLENNLHFIF